MRRRKRELAGVLFEIIMTRPFEDMFDYRRYPSIYLPCSHLSHGTVCCLEEGVMEPRAVETDQGLVCLTV